MQLEYAMQAVELTDVPNPTKRAMPPDRVDPIPARILIVDDRPENLVALEAVLEPLGQPIVRAHSGDEALKELLKHDFAAILLDVQMPGMDGFQTATMIKERERSRYVPIIFITAISTDRQQVFRGYSAGAVDYIFKPYDPEILQSKVRVFLDLFYKEQMIKDQAARLRDNDLREAARQRDELARQMADQYNRDIATRVRHFTREVLASVTEGRLRLCDTDDELPPPLSVAAGTISLQADGAIRELRKCVQEITPNAGLAEPRTLDFVTAVSEAAMNAVVHGVGGTAEISYDPTGLVQVRIRDRGRGIRIEDIPRATLERGYTTAGSMGHGFWIILKTADRIALMTGPSGTMVVLEQERVQPIAPWLQD